MDLSPAFQQTPAEALRNHLAMTHEILLDLARVARRAEHPHANQYAQWAATSGEHLEDMP